MNQFLRISLAILFPVVLSITWGAISAASEPPSQPNIIFILADDLGWQEVGYMGADFFETPNIDRLADQGMKISATYSRRPGYLIKITRDRG
jgi:hypothetical protein